MFLLVHVLATMQPPGDASAGAVAAPPRAARRDAPGDRLAAEAQRFLARGTLPAPGRRERLAVRLRRSDLDSRLRVGENALADRLLCARAAQLVAPAARLRLAGRLERAAGQPHHPHSRRFLAPYAAPELRALAAALREERVVHERGVALAAALLREGAPPRSADSFRGAALYALACLDPRVAGAGR